MKKVFFTLICLLAMMAMGTGLKAQEVTITLKPGWNWISYPNAEAMGIKAALGDFEPLSGDVIKSKENGQATWNNVLWLGALKNLVPGQGYMYYSSRTEVINFVFAKPVSSLVTTLEPTDITAVGAVVGSTVTIGQGNHVFTRGVCWGTEPNPTVDNSYAIGEAVDGDLGVMTGLLEPNTTYYVRAYVVTDLGLAYGNELSFTTKYIPVGAINGLFSVGESAHVYFSQGNLQYIGSAETPYWKFAENQWDCLGSSTGQNSSDQNVDRDLFGWGTSGYNHGAGCYQPWSTSTNYADYYAYGSAQYNLYDQTGQADWGSNAISNGGNYENTGWRTLTQPEWDYVFNSRTTESGIRYAKANVNGVNGVILLPDDWDSSTYSLNNTNQDGASFSNNTITSSQWAMLEDAGAVFLPAAGFRDGTSVYNGGSDGNYWSASYGSYDAWSAYFGGSYLDTDYGSRCDGFSVRLVADSDHDYVDLGLPSGLLWATCNVGAARPENYGDYFAWGETQPKETYNWTTYQYCNGSSNTLTKYCNISSYGYNGFTDDLTTLLPEDDAATANWGEGWRMPTQAEFQELLDNTTVTWTTQNGVNGRLFTASNGNSLFLPAAGFRYGSDLDDAGSYGYYWSSSLYTGSPRGAWALGFYSDYYFMGSYYRYCGQSVRPVRSGQN